MPTDQDRLWQSAARTAPSPAVIFARTFLSFRIPGMIVPMAGLADLFDVRQLVAASALLLGCGLLARILPGLGQPSAERRRLLNREGHACGTPYRVPELAAKIARSFMRPSGLFAKAVSQQLGDLLETLKGQPGLGQVEGERAPQYRGEARGQNAGYSFIRVDIQDELEGLGTLLGDDSNQAGDEQCSHIVGTSPSHRATRMVNGLEVEPVGDSGLEVDHHVLGHGICVGESQVMELGERGDCKFDRPLPIRLFQLRIIQQRRQRLSSEARQDERSVGIDPNRSTVEAPVDPALPLLPISLGENPYAGIQDPDQLTTQPDEERRVEQAVLSHLKLTILVDNPSLRVPPGSEQPPQSQAQNEVRTLH
jgi:hypothetical protein